jgi:tetratricopeptide (TPR) repeat protein/SAM-dependent methyltransferase
MTAVTTSLEKAVEHHQQGELDQAETLYQEILRIDPWHADALHLLGVAAHQRNQNETAVDYISRAIAVDDSASLYYSNLGASHRGLGNLEQAVECFRSSVEIDPKFAGGHYNLGMALEALERNDEAICAYWAALEANPQFVEAYNNLGKLFSSQGRYDEAIECFRKVQLIHPDSAEMGYNLGNAYFEDGQIQQAVDCYLEAISINPDIAQVHNNLGAAYKELKRYDDAAGCFERALGLQPDLSDARLNLATSLKLSGRDDEADACLNELISCNDGRADLRCALGDMLREQGRLAEARQRYEETIEIDPESTGAMFGLGFVHLSDGKQDQACECFERVIAVDPEHAAALTNLGAIYSSRGELDRAADCYARVVGECTESASAQFNLGNVRKDLTQLDEAAYCYREALKLDPELAPAHINLGVVLRNQGRIAESIDSHQRAVGLCPRDAEAHFHYALALLTGGDMERGWDEYEWRWEYDANARHFAEPAWQGEPLDDSHLLIHAEQGVGDEIMFASCFADVIGKTAATTMECDQRLIPLFARSFPLAHVIARPTGESDDMTRTIGFDRQIPAGSLPRFLRRNTAALPVQRRYLAADGERVAAWRTRYAELGDGLKVGISWRGGNNPEIRKQRSSKLDKWLPLLSMPGIDFVSLQYGECAQELAGVREHSGVVIADWDDADPLVDLDDFAAQMAALDLVISVDNSTVHMAGALGVPVWTLLPAAANWRWMLERDDSPWYSTMRLFRQPTAGDWTAVFEQVARELKAYSERPGGSGTHDGNPRRDDKQLASTQSASLHSAAIPPAELRGPSDFETDVIGSGTFSDDSAEDTLSNVTIQTLNPSSADSSSAVSSSTVSARIVTSTPEPPDEPKPSDASREKAKYETMWSHADYRRYSPGLHDADKVPLIDTLRKHGVRTILDAGCGSGKLMQRLMIEHADEFEVQGFDISKNCLDPFFDDIKDDVLKLGCLWDADDFTEVYDAIICTDVMEHIPTERVPDVLANFHRCTRKICYLAIALFDDNFGPRVLGEPLHLTVKEPNWWFAKLAVTGFRIEAYAVEQSAQGQDVWLHAFATVAQDGDAPVCKVG